MYAPPQINWPGRSGLKYLYWIYPIETAFNDAPGNYVFARQSSPGKWSPVYIGQSKNVAQRLSSHEKEECAKRNGATHIHVHSTPTEADRLSEELDLISRWKPPCNDRLAD
jgi:excinuclease UvrABC nuclease subunit